MRNGTYAEALAAGFDKRQAGMLARFGGEIRDEAVEEAAKPKGWQPGTTARMVRAWLVYSVDLAIAVTAWVVGFGIDVKNWPAVIGLGIVSRFVFHVMSMAFLMDDAKAADKRHNARSEPTEPLAAKVGSTDGLCHTGEE